MAPPRAPAFLALLLAASLAACSGGPRSASGEAADDYFPMVEGARWAYRIETSAGALDVEVTARGDMRLRGFPRPVFVMDERNTGPSLGFVESSPVAYVMDQGYVSRFTGLDYQEDGTLRSLGEDAPVRILPRPPTFGHTWEQQTHLFQTPEGGGAALDWSGEVKRGQPVTVPAGRFEDVVQIDMVYRDVWRDGTVHKQVLYEDTYARGVGLVRSVTRDPEGDPSHTVEQVLVDYEFP